MPDTESWDKYGFPDNLTFRLPYLPWSALYKALNERLEVFGYDPVPVPEYFMNQGGQSDESVFYAGFDSAYRHFVNPDKISSAQRYRDCFWNGDDLLEAALDGEDRDNITRGMRPQFSVKWAVVTYNEINLLRYIPTSDPEDWPDVFTYTDLNGTFNFQAPGVS